MTRERLLEDKGYMEKILERTAERCDIWQDRFIWAMARAIYDILDTLLKLKEKINEDQISE